MLQQPKISVITPSYNQGAYLEQTIRSVISQNYPNVEFIIIDGGSTDNSVEIIRKYAGQISYWCSEPDEGQSDALAKGFEKATGDILCWIGSDDLYLPGAFQKVADYFSKHPSVEFLSGGCLFVDAQGELLQTQALPFSRGVAATYDRLRYYEQDGVCQPSSFWRREAYLAVGGINRCRHFIMDFDLFARLAQRKRFGRIPDFLACFRLHEESKSSTIQHVRLKEFEKFVCEHGRYRYGSVFAHLMYWRYRLPSLIRKLTWYCLYRKEAKNQLEQSRCLLQ